jgi:hypothetical protein
MAIDIQALELGDPVNIGATDSDRLIVGDSLKAQFFVAEGVEEDGTPITPALFDTDNGGWAGSIDIEGSPFAASISGVDDTGEVTINIAPDTTTVGRHRYRIRVTNGTIPAKRYIIHGTIVVSPKYPP